MTEQDKKDNFKRIAERRTNEILDKISSFKNFTNNSFYQYDETQLRKITTAIVDELKEVMEVLRNEIK